MYEHFLITGATGYIGSLIVERLIREKKKVTVLVRDEKKLSECVRGKVTVVTCDVTDERVVQEIEENFDAIIHCASPTQSAYMVSHPVETARVIVNGTENMLRLAVRCHVKSMVYLSSMEVYGKIECADDERISEEKMGYLDLEQKRSSYPMGKRMAEHFCHLFWEEYGVPVKIARLAQTFGRNISKDDKRVFAQFSDAVRRKKDIVLHTAGNSVGNYCDVDETVDAILFLLEKGINGQVYNVVNEKNTMTIRQMAELVADKLANNEIKVTYDIPEGNQYGYAAETDLRMSAEKMRSLGWQAEVPLEDMYRRILER